MVAATIYVPLAAFLLLGISVASAEVISVQEQIKEKIRKHELVSALIGETRLEEIEIRTLYVELDSIIFDAATERSLPAKSSIIVRKTAPAVRHGRTSKWRSVWKFGHEVRVSTALDFGFEFKVELKFPVVEAGTEFTTNLKLTRSDVIDRRETVSTNRRIELIVKPYHAPYVEAKRGLWSRKLPFTAVVVTDADVIVHERYARFTPFLTTSKALRFRLLYPDSSDRQFLVRGELMEINAEELINNIGEQVLDPSEQCLAQLPGILVQTAETQIETVTETHTEEESEEYQMVLMRDLVDAQHILSELDQLASPVEPIDETALPDRLEFSPLEAN